MTLGDLLSLRDETIKNEIFSGLRPEERERLATLVERAFEEGARFWAEEQAEIIAGEGAWAEIVDVPQEALWERA